MAYVPSGLSLIPPQETKKKLTTDKLKLGHSGPPSTSSRHPLSINNSLKRKAVRSLSNFLVITLILLERLHRLSRNLVRISSHPRSSQRLT
jgi:hypothetical protein